MRIFNNTDLPLDVRDRVILPGLSIDYPSVTDQSLTPDERKAFKVGALGSVAGKTVRLREKLRLPLGAKPPVVSLPRLAALV